MSPKRDYNKRSLSNPYFPRKKHRHRIRRWFLFGVLVVVSLIAVSRWDRLRITTLSITGNEFVETKAIEEVVQTQMSSRRWFIFPQRNALFFSESTAKRQLKERFQFENVRISIKDFKSMAVVVTERRHVASVVTNGTKYHVDSRGVVLREFTAALTTVKTTENGTAVIRADRDSLSVPEIIDQNNDKAEIGKQLLPEEIISFVVNIDLQFRGRSDFEIVRYIMGAPGDTEITMVTSEGWQARLNSKEKPSAQAEAVLTVLRDKVTDRSKLEYIDVRFGDKIFYQ